MRIQYNSPVILSFSILTAVIHAIAEFTPLDIATEFFTVRDSMSITSPLDYFRLCSHVLGHSDWQHLTGNLTFILLLGPILEERYGSRPVLVMIFATALITGFINVAVPFFDGTWLRGASGVVFMLIVLSSLVNVKRGTVPLTFILIVVIFVGKEILAILREDQVSQMAHIIGGALGSFFGFTLQDETQQSGQPPVPYA